MGQPVVHFELQGKDREALSRFYAQLFGWKTNDVPMNYTMVERAATEESTEALAPRLRAPQVV